MRHSYHSMLVLAGLSSVLLLQGCVVAAVGGTAAGASAAHDRRTVGTIVEDENIELKAIQQLFKTDKIYSQSHIEIVSYNNIVLLVGQTPTEELKRKAGSTVAKIPKVRRVHNELRVAAPSAYLVRSGDTWITSKVKTQLLTARSIDASRIKVITENGEVFLMGMVTRDEAKEAIDITRQVDGVQKVINVFEYIN